MLNYQTLDAIADAVNPVMGVVALLFPWLRPSLRVQRALIMDLLTLAAVGLAYAVMAVDASVGLWGRLGLDYSTHAAVYIAIASALWQYGGVGRLLGSIVGVAYAALMLWQKYHAVLDIVATAAVMLSLLMLFWWLIGRRHLRLRTNFMDDK
jgi:hypothetical protein